ncbi:hypothetical protein SGRIM128S_00572 [Streptomyces griseomycini]
MHGHLVTVEVRVERGADERVDLDGLALDQLRLERLDAEAVQGGARFSGRVSAMTSSRTSYTTVRPRSTMRLAGLMFCAWFRSTRRFIADG